MTFAFLVHPLRRRDYLRGSFSESRWLPRVLRNRFFKYAVIFLSPPRAWNHLKSFFGPQTVFTYPTIVSETGVTVRGEVVAIPMVSEELVGDQARAVALLRQARTMLASRGVGMIGLGGVNGVVGSYGRAVARDSPVPVTTGAAYTVHSAVETLRRTAAALGLHLPGLPVTLVGLPGRNARAIARLLLQEGVELTIVGPPEAPYMLKLMQQLSATGSVLISSPDRYLERLPSVGIVVAASSVGEQIDARRLPPGTVVIDVSLPRDVSNLDRRRDDILVVDGEVVCLPPGTGRVADFFGCGDQHVLACFAEAAILAMEHRKEHFTIGRDIDLDRVEEIGLLAKKHGFAVDRLYSFRQAVSERRIETVRRAQRSRTAKPAVLAFARAERAR